MKPFYACKGCTLYRGDFLEVLEQLSDSFADLIFTDPPYGMTDLEWDKPQDLAGIWEAFRGAIKFGCSIIFTASQPFTSHLVVSNPKWFRTEWIWQKNAGSNFATVKWHPMKEHESVLVFGDRPGTYNPIRQPRSKPLTAGYTNTSNTGKRKAYSGVTHNQGFTVTDGEMRVPSSIQRFNRERGLHPNQKPVDLCEYFIRTYSNEGDTILDPFCGSASTGIACLNTGRNFIGIEKDPKYCEVARNRLKQALAK